MTTIYRAFFQDGRRLPCTEEHLKNLQPKDRTICFRTAEMIDRSRDRLLLVVDQEPPKWYGAWIPHSDWAVSKENAVQILRWWTLDKRTDDPEYYGGEKLMHKILGENALRRQACEEWLSSRGVDLIDPWWRPGWDRKKAMWIP